MGHSQILSLCCHMPNMARSTGNLIFWLGNPQTKWSSWDCHLCGFFSKHCFNLVCSLAMAYHQLRAAKKLHLRCTSVGEFQHGSQSQHDQSRCCPFCFSLVGAKVRILPKIFVDGPLVKASTTRCARVGHGRPLKRLKGTANAPRVTQSGMVVV